MSNDKLLGRIGALLRQAESTDNEHEAQAFLAAAQRLATATSIDLAVARSHTSQRERRATPVSRTISIGEPGTKGLRSFVALFVVIAHANDVKCDIARNSTYVVAHGFSDDVTASEQMYAHVVIQMVRAADAYLRTGEHRTGGTKPTATITARINFQLAFGARIGERLAAARNEARAQAIADDDAEQSQGTALALRDKDLELVDYYRKASSARGTWRATSASAGYSERARRAGAAAGSRARLQAEAELARGSRELRA